MLGPAGTAWRLHACMPYLQGALQDLLPPDHWVKQPAAGLVREVAAILLQRRLGPPAAAARRGKDMVMSCAACKHVMCCRGTACAGQHLRRNR